MHVVIEVEASYCVMLESYIRRILALIVDGEIETISKDLMLKDVAVPIFGYSCLVYGI